MGDSVIIEFFDWNDPASDLDINPNLASLDFFYDKASEMTQYL